MLPIACASGKFCFAAGAAAISLAAVEFPAKKR